MSSLENDVRPPTIGDFTPAVELPNHMRPWRNMIARRGQIAAMAESIHRVDDLAFWAEGVALARQASDQAGLDALNAHFNRIPYVQDVVNYARRDVWDAPLDFIARGGDCDGFTLAKYYALREAGWPAGSAWPVTGDAGPTGHMLLLVRLPEQPAVWVVLDLDRNFTFDVVDMAWFRPSMALSEEAMWLYRYQAPAPMMREV